MTELVLNLTVSHLARSMRVRCRDDAPVAAVIDMIVRQFGLDPIGGYLLRVVREDVARTLNTQDTLRDQGIANGAWLWLDSPDDAFIKSSNQNLANDGFRNKLKRYYVDYSASSAVLEPTIDLESLRYAIKEFRQPTDASLPTNRDEPSWVTLASPAVSGGGRGRGGGRRGENGAADEDDPRRRPQRRRRPARTEVRAEPQPPELTAVNILGQIEAVCSAVVGRHESAEGEVVASDTRRSRSRMPSPRLDDSWRTERRATFTSSGRSARPGSPRRTALRATGSTPRRRRSHPHWSGRSWR